MYALDGFHDQAKCIVDLHSPAVVSADLAADLTSSWRRPSRVVVWTRHPLDLDSVGFVTAGSKAVASVVIRTTDDDRMLAEAETVDGLPLASRLQQAADLLDLGGSDRVEAASVLLAEMCAAP